MSGPARRSFRYLILHFRCLKIWLILCTKELIVCMLCVTLLSEIPAEIHWPDLHWRWERWSGPERAFIHAEAGRGSVPFLHHVDPLRWFKSNCNWWCFLESQLRSISNMNVFISVSQISVVGDPVLNVSCLHVQSFDAELYRQLICYPQVMSFFIFIITSCALYSQFVQFLYEYVPAPC